MHIRAYMFADHAQVLVHYECVDRRCQQRHRIAVTRIHCAVHVDPVVLRLLDRLWPRAAQGPPVRQRALLSEPRLVLEPDLDNLFDVRLPDVLDKRGASANQAAMAVGSFLRCWGRGLRYEKPKRCSKS